jgi:hypothetical protein
VAGQGDPGSQIEPRLSSRDLTVQAKSHAAQACAHKQAHCFNYAGQFVTSVVAFAPWSPTVSRRNFCPAAYPSHVNFAHISGSFFLGFPHRYMVKFASSGIAYWLVTLIAGLTSSKISRNCSSEKPIAITTSPL